MSRMGDLLEKLGRLDEALPSLPKGVKLPKDLIRILVRIRVGSKSEWTKISGTPKPKDFKATVMLGVGRTFSVMIAKDDKAAMVHSVHVIEKGRARELHYLGRESAKSMKLALALIDINLGKGVVKNLTWYSPNTETMPSKSKGFGQREVTPEVKLGMDKIGKWLSGIVGKSQENIEKGLNRDLTQLFALLQQLLENPGSMNKYENNIRKILNRLQRRLLGVQNFAQYIEREFASTVFGNTIGALNHKDVVKIKQQMSQAISGMSKW